MSIADYFAEQTGNNLPDDLRVAMRHMAGGVSVITAGTGDERTGLTAITARSLSIEPPRMLICVSSTASTWPVIRKYRHFAVNILRADQQAVAERFAGRKGEKGVQRYLGADWVQLASGASGLADALAMVDCEVEEIFERHNNGIIIGAVLSATLGPIPECDPLLYAHGDFASPNPGTPPDNGNRC